MHHSLLKKQVQPISAGHTMMLSEHGHALQYWPCTFWDAGLCFVIPDDGRDPQGSIL